MDLAPDHDTPSTSSSGRSSPRPLIVIENSEPLNTHYQFIGASFHQAKSYELVGQQQQQHR
jgi:hypothetical protein